MRYRIVYFNGSAALASTTTEVKHVNARTLDDACAKADKDGREYACDSLANLKRGGK